MAKIIGIDLGTTNSCVAVMEGGKATVIPNSEGGRTTPSVVAFSRQGERLVGAIAKRQAITNPENTVSSIKRFMGRRRSEVRHEEELVPYRIVADTEDVVQVQIGDRRHTPPEMSAMILQYLKKAAEDYLGTGIREAVITVPAYFNDAQRQATKDAGRIAGLDVKRIINEPTAASLAYGLDKKGTAKIAVFDFGGGTFDISILEIGEGVFEVKSTNGDTHLGGDDIDQILIDYVADDFKHNTGIDIRADRLALQRLKDAAEKAKCELSSAMRTSVNLPFISADAAGPKHLDMTITRARFESLIEPLIARMVEPCKTALSDAGMSAKEIDEVILVGGATRIPAVQEQVKQIFGKEPSKGVNPDEVVAIGAAIQGAVLGGDESVREVVLLDVTPLSLGIETLGGVMTKLIERNTTIPTKKTQTFSTAADNQTAVTIMAYQGEREMAAHNRLLGKFDLVGIPAAPRGVPQIDVTFDIDANGILNVSARDKATGKEQAIRIEASSGLSESRIQQMVKDAEAHAQMDREQKERVEAKNEAEHLVYQSERTLADGGDKIGGEERRRVQGAIDDLKEKLKGEDTAAIRSSMDALMKASHGLAQQMYGHQQGQGPPSGEQQKQEQQGPVEAEYEEVNESDRQGR